tara:strand:+ start:1660 stop:2643 length:984 start_codon:yes stop_codon:yes gene_type:complete
MKEKSALFNLNKGYKSPLEGNAFGGKLKENMDKGMSKSDAAKQAAADLQDMPVDNRAGGSTPAANMNKGYGQQVKSPMSNLNKGYGQQVTGPLNVDGIIVKGLRSLRNSISSIGSDFEKSKVRKNRIASGEANDTKLQGIPTKAPKFSTGGYNKATADTKLKTSLSNSTKPMPGGSTQIPSVGTSGVQNDGSGNEGYGVGGSTKKPAVKVKPKPIVKARKTVNAVKTTSASAQKIKTTGPKVKSAEAKADLKIMPIVKDATSSRKSRRIQKAIGKATEARAKGTKAIKNIKSSSSASDVAKNQAKALKQRRKYDRMKKRVERISKRK